MKRKSNVLSKGIKAINLSLWIEKEKTLVIGDLHLGYEEMLNSQGTMMPRINYSEIKQRLDKILAEIKEKSEIEKIIINGDLKHEFGTISQQEWNETLDMLDFLQKNSRLLILIRGNHDNILGPIAAFKRATIKKEGVFLEKEKIFITHGSQIPQTEEFAEAKTVIIGHEHPAVSLREATKQETYKCFLKGKFEEKELIVMPSMSSIAYGTDVLKHEFLSPFLENAKINEFEIWVVEDKVYYFGKIKNITG